MRRVLMTLFLFGAVSFLGCQQTQEADDAAGDTDVIREERETVVQPADEPDVDMDVNVDEGGGGGAGAGGGDAGASGEVSVGDEGASGEVEVQNP